VAIQSALPVTDRARRAAGRWVLSMPVGWFDVARRMSRVWVRLARTDEAPDRGRGAARAALAPILAPKA